MPIHFGTDGWRAVISDTFTFSNLRLVAQAIADALRSENWNNGIPLPADVDKNRWSWVSTHVFYQTAMLRMWRASWRQMVFKSSSPMPMRLRR